MVYGLGKLVVASLIVAGVSGSSPTDSYVPGAVSCPGNGTSLVRQADSLSDDEKSYISDRVELTKEPLTDFLTRGNLTDLGQEISAFVENSTIKIGLAFSGGGYRAMLSGAGELAALDNRTINSTNDGNIGGILQASTYLTGLSGGNWLVNSIVINNYTTVQALQGDSDVWDLHHSIISPDGINIFGTASYWKSIADDVKAKRSAGFNVSLTDIWGRALSYQFFNASDGGPALTLSDVRDYDAFTSREMPYPINVADGRAAGTTIIGLNSTVFEISPYELGSWDSSLYAFVDTKYLGSTLSGGVPDNSSACVEGYDNAGFLMGTSSSLFNQFILRLNSTGVEGVVYDLAQDILSDLADDSDDIAIYHPNPFEDYVATSSAKSVATSEFLELVDGGEDNQNVPLAPLLVQERDVDIIFAFDNSADTDEYWANGSSLVQTYMRQFESFGNHTAFPYVPDTETFINQGLVETPTFFGCNGSNLTSLLSSDNATVPPLVVFFANYPHSYLSNTSTFKLKYSEEEMADMIQNGYNIASRSNSTLDSNWTTCLGCAIIQRERERRGFTEPTDQCSQCFSKYCWDGTRNSSAIANDSSLLYPSLINSDSSESESTSESSASASASATGKKKNSASSSSVSTLASITALVVCLLNVL